MHGDIQAALSIAETIHPSATEEPQGVCRHRAAPSPSVCSLSPCWRAGGSALGTSCKREGLLLLNVLDLHRPPGARSPPTRREHPARAMCTAHRRVERASSRARHKAVLAPAGRFQLRGKRASLGRCYFYRKVPKRLQTFQSRASATHDLFSLTREGKKHSLGNVMRGMVMWADIFPWKHPRDTAPWYVAENTSGNVRPLRAQSGRLAGDAAPRTRASTPLPLHSPSLQWGWHGGTLGTQRPWLGGADRLPAYPRCGGAS